MEQVVSPWDSHLRRGSRGPVRNKNSQRRREPCSCAEKQGGTLCRPGCTTRCTWCTPRGVFAGEHGVWRHHSAPAPFAWWWWPTLSRFCRTGRYEDSYQHEWSGPQRVRFSPKIEQSIKQRRLENRRIIHVFGVFSPASSTLGRGRAGGASSLSRTFDVRFLVCHEHFHRGSTLGLGPSNGRAGTRCAGVASTDTGTGPRKRV